MSYPAPDSLAPGLDLIEALALDQLLRLPAAFREAADKVVLRVEDLADAELAEEMGCDSPYELTGIYDGIPLTQKSTSDQPAGPDVITLFRRAILEEWIERGDIGLSDLVAHVFIHELAHHFGWSDADIAAIDRWWE